MKKEKTEKNGKRRNLIDLYTPIEKLKLKLNIIKGYKK